MYFRYGKSLGPNVTTNQATALEFTVKHYSKIVQVNKLQRALNRLHRTLAYSITPQTQSLRDDTAPC